MLILTAVLCLLICLFSAAVCAKAEQRKWNRMDLLSSLILYAALAIFEICVYSQPGITHEFGLFRTTTICLTAVWASGLLCACRLRQRLNEKKMVLVFLIAALGLEVFVCNMPFFATYSYLPLDLMGLMTDNSQVKKNSDDTYTISIPRDCSSVLSFQGIYLPVYNLYLENFHVDPLADTFNNTNFAVNIDIYASDDAHSKENRLSNTSWYVASRQEISHTIATSFAGNVHSLRLIINNAAATSSFMSVPGDAVYDGTDYYTFRSVTINARRPFVFHAVRFGLLFVLMYLLYLFRPHSRLWQERYLDHEKTCRRHAAGIVIVMSAFMTALVFAVPLVYGIATPKINPDHWDSTEADGRSFLMYDLYNTNHQYGLLAENLAVGKTYLSLDPDPRLYEAANPYDQDSRADTEAIFLWDAAYYNRRYYVYFGVVPCLMFQLPYYLAVGKTDLPVYVDCLFFAILFAAAAFLVVDQLVRRWYPRASKAVYYLSGAAILFGTPLLYTTSRPAIYSTAIISADAFMMLGFWQWLKAANTPADERSPAKGLIRHLMLGSFFMALTAGCRPTELIYIFLCLPLFYDLYIRRRRLKTRRGKMEILLFLVPFIVIAALQMRYNDLRFGSPINFGANYNLTTNDMTKRGCSPWRIMPALHSLLFQPPLISSVFPYICEIVPTTNLVGTHITQPTFGGILTAVPACWILYLTPVFRRRIKADKHALWYIELYMLAAAVIVTIADAQIAGILYRYIMDFAPGLLTAAVVLFMETEEWCQKTSSSPTAEERNFWLR